MTTVRLVRGLLFLVLLGAAARGQLPACPQVPTGFIDETVVTGLVQPVALAFESNARFFVAEQRSGNIWCCLTDGSKSLIGTVPNVLASPLENERGLLGIAVDPNWPARPFLYVSFNRISPPGMSVVRHEVTGPVANPNSTALALGFAYDILTGLPDLSSHHNGGGLRFDGNGLLYASFGDDNVNFNTPCTSSSWTVGDGRGEIFRMDVANLPASGSGPPLLSTITPVGNPSYAAQPAGQWAGLVWCQGFRNPFRFNIDSRGPGATNNLYIADVGESAWEELDEQSASAPGGHFGWPWLEGPSTYLICPSAPPAPSMSAPVALRGHSPPAGWHSIISMPRYRYTGGVHGFGQAYDGDVFFADYVTGVVDRIQWNGTSWVGAPGVAGQPTSSWGMGFQGLSDAVQAPDGAIYWVKHTSVPGGQGAVHRIRGAVSPTVAIAAGDNQVGVQGRPLAQPLEVQVTSGGLPMAGVCVLFNAPTGTLSPQQTLTDASGHAQSVYTLDPVQSSSPQITATVPGGPAATFNATWRGLVITYPAAPSTCDVTVEVWHSLTNSPVTVAMDVPVPNPHIANVSSGWGPLWINIPPTYGALIDGLGLFGIVQANALTGATIPVLARNYPLPQASPCPVLGISVLFQAFAVDGAQSPPVMLSDKVVVAF